MQKQTRILVSILLITVIGSIAWYSVWERNHPVFGKVQTVDPVQQRPATATVRENPVAPEKNPPGDIPDSQVFVNYVSPTGGYELQVPEGWARTVKGADVRFVDKYDGLEVKITETDITPTLEGVRSRQVIDLEKNGHAVRVTNIKAKKLAKEKAIQIAYESNSEPNLVTGKQIRLENICYLFYKNGKLAVLTLWSPLGADNVDQWKLIANSFEWRP